MDFVGVKWLSDDGVIVCNSGALSFVSFKDFCSDLIMLIDLNSKHRRRLGNTILYILQKQLTTINQKFSLFIVSLAPPRLRTTGDAPHPLVTDSTGRAE